MDGFAPNMAILKGLGNWFLVAFAVVLLTFSSHILFKDAE